LKQCFTGYTFSNHFSTPECTKGHLQQSKISKFFRGRTLTPLLSVKGEGRGKQGKEDWGREKGGGDWKEGKGRMGREALLQTKIYHYATAHVNIVKALKVAQSIGASQEESFSSFRGPPTNC